LEKNKSNRDESLTDSSSYANSVSPSIKAIIFVLTLLYALGSAAAFIAVILGEGRHETMRLRAELIRHGLQHLFISSICGMSLFLSIKRSKIAGLTAGIAVLITGFLALKALISSLGTGFHAYHWVEPLIVLPCVVFVIWSLTRRKKISQTSRPNAGSTASSAPTPPSAAT